MNRPVRQRKGHAGILAFAVALALAASGCAASGPVPGAGPPPTATTRGPAPQLPRAGRVPAPNTGAYLGVYDPPAPFPPDGLDAYEKTTSKSCSIVMWYQPWAATNRSAFDTAAAVSVMRRGKIPMITWEPWDPGSNARTVVNPGVNPAYSLAKINAGAFDGYIRTWARDIRTLGGPVMLRPMHEMNGDWYPWCGTTNGNSPAAFVKAWRHIHDIFTAEGATNVTWVWSINRESVPAGPRNAFAAYYPGDAYVDWTAISGFNGADSSTSPLWKPYSALYQQPLAYLQGLGKPICIAEISTLGNGPEKATWITDAFATIEADPRVSAVVYFESLEVGAKTQDWRATVTPPSLDAYRRAVTPAHFLGGTPAVLKGWADSLDTEQWRYLTAFEPKY